MNTFFKTFFICLIATFSFLAYKYFSVVGTENNLEVSDKNPLYVFQKEKNNQENYETEIPQEITEKPDEQKTPDKQIVNQTYKHICYFYTVNGELIPITRELKTKTNLESTITLLLKGPTISETKKGIYSEIPANVDLMSVKRNEKSIIVNLTSNFGNGGGTQSVENRVKQLSKTIKKIEPNKSIFLYINGKEVEYLGGDGVYIKQPLE